jgi:hypothetical protein
LAGGFLLASSDFPFPAHLLLNRRTRSDKVWFVRLHSGFEGTNHDLRRGEFAVNTQVKGSKRNRLAGIFVMFFAMMVFLVPKTQAADVTGTVEKQMSTNEAPVIEATGTPSFGTEDWVGPQEQGPVVVMETPSFGTEDWVGPQEQGPAVAMISPSFGTEDWTGTMESSEALGAGAMPAPACEDVSSDDYSPEC